MRESRHANTKITGAVPDRCRILCESKVSVKIVVDDHSSSSLTLFTHESIRANLRASNEEYSIKHIDQGNLETGSPDV